ncbi:hypothetical protein OCU04_009045 [Sclerotinia nivalis]|uniref:Uncharacterized protein n=1 Tax=Sclerotinia nivalis TaxID=352851 RepID=A0A9X0AGR8_9HELO|nr:hypothetical protein OCU04_009045 [Sclerotinia nivalis]
MVGRGGYQGTPGHQLSMMSRGLTAYEDLPRWEEETIIEEEPDCEYVRWFMCYNNAYEKHRDQKFENSHFPERPKTIEQVFEVLQVGEEWTVKEHSTWGVRIWTHPNRTVIHYDYTGISEPRVGETYKLVYSDKKRFGWKQRATGKTHWQLLPLGWGSDRKPQTGQFWEMFCYLRRTQLWREIGNEENFHVEYNVCQFVAEG